MLWSYRNPAAPIHQSQRCQGTASFPGRPKRIRHPAFSGRSFFRLSASYSHLHSALMLGRRSFLMKIFWIPLQTASVVPPYPIFCLLFLYCQLQQECVSVYYLYEFKACDSHFFSSVQFFPDLVKLFTVSHVVPSSVSFSAGTPMTIILFSLSLLSNISRHLCYLAITSVCLITWPCR